MSILENWIGDAGAALGLAPDQVPVGRRDELLDLTRDVAHGVARIAGPLTCYLIGVAVGRGMDPGEATAAVGRLLATRPADDDDVPQS